MVFTLKYTCTQQVCARLLMTTCRSVGYKITQQEFEKLLNAASNPNYNCDPHELNKKLIEAARYKYKTASQDMVAANHQRVWLAISWRKDSIFGVSVTWKDENYRLFLSAEQDDFPWKIHYGRILYRLVGDFKNLPLRIEINEQDLKIGEWFAAILFSLSGDDVGMLATLDEAEDRK